MHRTSLPIEDCIKTTHSAVAPHFAVDDAGFAVGQLVTGRRQLPGGFVSACSEAFRLYVISSVRLMRYLIQRATLKPILSDHWTSQTACPERPCLTPGRRGFSMPSTRAKRAMRASPGADR